MLRVREPRVRAPDSAQDAKLEAPLQVLPLVSKIHLSSHFHLVVEQIIVLFGLYNRSTITVDLIE